VRGQLVAALDALRDGLERRKDVASARALLELMQDTAHVMSKVCA
jgi:AmiR/NasT family two-component response regulator